MSNMKFILRSVQEKSVFFLLDFFLSSSSMANWIRIKGQFFRIFACPSPPSSHARTSTMFAEAQAPLLDG